jgi:hypothetical protein
MWCCWISPNDNSAPTHGSPRSELRAARVFKGEARVSIHPGVRPTGKDSYRTGQVQEYDSARFAARSSTWPNSWLCGQLVFRLEQGSSNTWSLVFQVNAYNVLQSCSSGHITLQQQARCCG